MKRQGAAIYALAALGIVAGCGGGAVVIAQRLPDNMVTALVSTLIILGIIVVVGGLLIANNAVVARSVWGQLALLDKMRGQRAPSVNIRVPQPPADRVTTYQLPSSDGLLQSGPNLPFGFGQRYEQSAAFRDLTGAEDGLDDLEIE